MTRCSCLFGLAVLSIFFLATTTQARDQFQFRRGQDERSHHNNFLRQEQFLSPSKGLSLPIPTAKRDLARQMKWVLKRSTRGVPAQDSDFSMGCFTGCLKAYGVSAAQLAGCGAICTVNYVGCAVCAGASEWIMLGCAQYCVWRGLLVFDQGAANRRPHHSATRPLQRLVTSDLQSAS